MFINTNFNNRKGNKIQPRRERTLKLEALEERELLSVSPSDILDDAPAAVAPMAASENLTPMLSNNLDVELPASDNGSLQVCSAKYATPAGYNDNDYQKMVAFLELTDSNGVKNGTKINPRYDPLKPSSFVVYWITVNGEKRIEFINSWTTNDLVGAADFSNMTSLTHLYCYSNKLTSLNVSGCNALSYIACENNQLRLLNLTGCSSLYYLNCSDNILSSLNVFSCPLLQDLNCNNNQLTTLNVSNHTKLLYLNCKSNNLKELNASGCTKLRDFFTDNISNNPLEIINLSGCEDITFFQYYGTANSYTTLKKLDLSGCTSLATLHCEYGQLTSLNVSGCTLLHYIDCSHNQLTQLDLRNTYSSLTSIYIDSNPNLSHVFLSSNAINRLKIYFEEQWSITDSKGTRKTTIHASTTITYYYCPTELPFTATNPAGTQTVIFSSTVSPQLSTPTLSASANGSNSISVNIGSVANASGYTVQYSRYSNFSSSDTISFQTPGYHAIYDLDANATYYVRVKANGTVNYSDSNYSAYCTVKTNSQSSQLTGLTLSTSSPVVGEALTAIVTPAAATCSYQWSYSASLTGTYYNISGATSASFTPTSTYSGKYLKCTATGTGNYSGTASAVTANPVTLVIDNVGDSISNAKSIAFTNNAFTFTDKLGEGAYGLKDVDIYKLIVTAADISRTYTFTTSLPSGGTSVDTYIRLFDSAGNELVIDDDGGDSRYSSLTWTPSASGTYYLGVSSYSNRAYDPAIAGSATSDGTAGDYKLTVTRTAATNTFIDNVGDSISNKKDVTFTNNAFTFTDKLGEGTYGLKDVDIYKLFVSASDINRCYTFTTSLPSGGTSVDTYIRLFDSDGNDIAFNDDGGDDYRYSSLTWSPSASGTYYLGVSSYYNCDYDPLVAGSSDSDGTAGDYTLTVVRTGAVKLQTPTLSVSKSATTSDSITVYVGIVTNASGFKAQYSTDANFTEPMETIFEEYGNNTIYDLDSNQTYYIRVMALGSDDYSDSDFSSTKSETTKTAVNKLNAPAFTVAVTGSDTVSVNVESVPHASGYKVQYSQNANFTNPKYHNVTSGSNTINGLNANTTYYFRVMAIASNNYTNSNYSAAQSVRTNYEYESSEVASLREFLEQTDSNGVKNGVKINGAYSADDASTWLGVTWSDFDGVMRVTEIDWDGKELHGSLNLSACTKLTCLYVSYTYSDEGSRYNNITHLDVTGCASLRRLFCGYNLLTELNVSNNSLLEDLYCYCNQLTELNVSNNLLLTDMNCSGNQITNLNLESNLALGLLTCSSNPLGSLNVDNNVNLWQLNCSGCQLTSLDVTNNVNLTQLRCGYNQLTSLDVWINADLWHLDCRGNYLTELDLSNNAELWELYCDDNLLSSLDVTNNPLLRWFGCSYNRLTSLDVTNNTALLSLYCTENLLTSLDVTNNTDLLTLYCNYNQLSSLDVSNNTALTMLSCWNPDLRIVRINPATEYLYIYFNSPIWTFLDVNGNTLSDEEFGLPYSASDSASLPITAVNPYDDQTINIVNSPVEALVAPTFTVSLTGANSVTVNVDSVANASGYTVEYSADPYFNNVKTRRTYSLTASLDGLVDDATNYIRVKANGVGSYVDSDYSSVQSVALGAMSTAKNDYVQTAQNSPITISYRANDNVADWSAATTLFGEPSHGEYTLNANGTITYTPESGFFGMDSIGYGVVTPSGRIDIAEISIYVGSTIAASVQNESSSHNSSIPMAASIDSLTDWDNCFVELWAEGVNALSAGSATVTLEYNPEVYNAPVFSNSADNVTWTVSQSVLLPNGNVQVELNAQVLKPISSQTDNLFLGTVVLTPSEEGSGVEDAEPVCVLNGVSLTQTVTAMPYDLLRNGAVDVNDFIAFATVFGTNPETMDPDSPQYSQAVKADFNNDGVVDVEDFISFAINFGAKKRTTDIPMAQACPADSGNREWIAESCEEMDSNAETLVEQSAAPNSQLVNESKVESSMTLLEAYSAALLDLYDNQNRADLSDASNALAETRMDEPVTDYSDADTTKTSYNAVDAVLDDELLTIDWE